MKRLIYTLSLSLLWGLGVSAAPVYKRAKAETKPPKEIGKALERVPDVVLPQSSRNSGKKRLNGSSSAADFIGNYYWNGLNYLSGEVYPNSGYLSVREDGSNPDSFIISGLVYQAELRAYFEDGCLVVPNQSLGIDSYTETEKWFWNYSMELRDNEYGESIYYFIKNDSSYFYFTLDEDGNLQAGRASYDKWSNLEYTNEELLRDLCLASVIFPEGPEGFYLLSGWITGKPIKVEDFSFNPEEWNYEGMAIFRDCWFQVLWENYESPVYEVPLYSSKETFGRYLLLNPYGYDTPYGEINMSAKDGYLIFDISDSNCVLFEPVFSGTFEILEEGIPVNFYCLNDEGYSHYLLQESISEIMGSYGDRGIQPSNFDAAQKTVNIFNPVFMMGDDPEAYHWVSDVMSKQGYIIFPNSTTPETTNPFSPVTPFAISSLTPGVTKTFDVIVASNDVIENLMLNYQIVNDWRTNDTDRFLYIWDNTFTGGEATSPGVGFEGYQLDGYISLNVGNMGWSGAGFNFAQPGVNTSHWSEETSLHIAYRTESSAPGSVAFLVGDGDNGGTPAKIAVGEPFNDNGNIYPSVGPAPTEEWQAFDISFSQIKALYPSFDYTDTENWTGNILSILAGGVPDKNICIDCVYFYTPDIQTPSPEPVEDAYYIIGDNVNGKIWSLAQPDCIFEEISDGVYRWSGQLLSSGFKINNGTWNDPQKDFGGSSQYISMNQPYDLSYMGSNINFADFLYLLNPVVEFDLNNMTVTLVGGEPQGTVYTYVYYYLCPGDGYWYYMDDNYDGTYSFIDDYYYSTLYIPKGIYFVKETQRSNGYYSQEYIGAGQTNPFIGINDPYELNTDLYSSSPIIYFRDFDLLGRPSIMLDTNSMSATILSGETFIDSNEEAKENYYIFYNPFEGETVVEQLQSLGDGKYFWRGESFYGTFYIEAFDSSNNYYYIDEPETLTILEGETYDVVKGKFGYPFLVDQRIENPTVILDLKNLKITVTSGNVPQRLKGALHGTTDKPNHRVQEEKAFTRVLDGVPVRIVKQHN